MITDILIIIIAVLIGVVLFYRHQLKLQLHYYDYKSNKAAGLEKTLSEEQKKNRETLESLNKIAYVNPISKIWNLEYFIEQSLELFRKNPAARFTMITFCISNMVSVNKLFGSGEGDKAVVYTASNLRYIGQRKRFLFAHLYSNLFGLVMDTQSETAIFEVINEITAVMENYTDSFSLEPSFGIYEIADKKEPVLDMINHTMLAQNLIRSGKETNYMFYTEELDQQFRENKKMSMEMEQAMQDHKFLMYLQPMVNLRSFKITSAEALVRWDHPEKGILSPYAFLPLFEGTSLVERLDYYMWEECCKTIRRWIDNKMEPTPISMNISPIHFESPRFIKKLNELTEHYLIDKKLLILELPERGISNASGEVMELIHELHDNGYMLCIDNFGDTYSPLNLLLDLPIDAIKIDRRFLNKNISSEEGLTILRYLIAMALEVGLEVYAEGVETEEQANFLAEIGTCAAQGYFFSKPIDLREFDALNKSMVNLVYKGDEYYPTFEDLEKDLDLIDYLLRQEAGSPAEFQN